MGEAGQTVHYMGMVQTPTRKSPVPSPQRVRQRASRHPRVTTYAESLRLPCSGLQGHIQGYMFMRAADLELFNSKNHKPLERIKAYIPYNEPAGS